MRRLIQGIIDFRKNLTEESRELFSRLALGQKPDTLFIACCDSRVVPNLFASTDPGDLFVLRNMGNLVPPVTSSQDDSVSAALEFSISSLKITDIVICGHSECGAMQALAQGVENFFTCPHLISWLKHGQPSLDRVKNGFIPDPSLSLHNQISQANVLQQIEHVKSYPFVREQLESEQLRIHGWWFDIARADVYSYEENLDQFILIS
jgi:carbonic anhydrase